MFRLFLNPGRLIRNTCFVTRMRRKGIPDQVIMKITEHQSMECFKRYDTISEDDLKRAFEVKAKKTWNKAGISAFSTPAN